MKAYDDIFVPTYGRKEMNILKLLVDDSVHINLCVRSEADDDGFYDELKENSQISIIRLGYGISDVGETRHAILEYCHQNNIEFCPMFDDTVLNILDSNDETSSISKILTSCIELMKNDELSQYVVGYAFPKRYGFYADGRKILMSHDNKKYFSIFPAQAYIINVKKAYEHNIQYKSFNKFGFEDTNFFVDCLKAGLIYIDRENFLIDATVPNETKVGGTHEKDENLERKFDKESLMSMRYIGNMMGISIEKRYRSFAKGLTMHICPKLSFFREVLVYNRKDNSKIIDNSFDIEKCLLKSN